MRLEAVKHKGLNATVRRVMRPGAVLALLLPALAATVQAQDASAPPSNYVAALLGTTLGYKPPGGSWDGWQKDFSTTLGYGRQLTPKLALELDLGPTWVSGSGYSSFALVPGLVWSFNPTVYAAARFVVPVDPEPNLVLLPGGPGPPRHVTELSALQQRILALLQLPADTYSRLSFDS